MHRQYTTYIKQDAIITIRWYLATCFGRDRPKHVAKYHLIVIIASCLMYVVYWRCMIYYTDLIIHNGVVSLSLSLSLSLSKKKRVELPGKLLIFKSYMAFNCNKFRFTKYRVSGQIRMKVHETHINAMPSRYLQYSVMTLWWTHGEVGVGWLQWKHRNAATVAADGIHGNPRQPANHTDMRGIAITMVTR